MNRSVFLLVVVGCLATWPVFGFEPSAAQAEMYQLHCRHRARHGLSAQRLDPGLCRLAQRLAEAQAYHGVMFHSRWGWRENVAYGADPARTMTMWIESPGHNANLLSGELSVGFGYCGIYAASLHGAPYTGDILEVTVGESGTGRRRLLGRRR